jgi:hypothetical protein
LRLLGSKHIQGRAKRADRVALNIPTQGMAQHFRIKPHLECETRRYASIPRSHVSRATSLERIDEDFSKPPVTEWPTLT